MEELQRETITMSREAKLHVLRGLMQCVGTDGRATRDFELRMALGAAITVPQAQVVKTILDRKSVV